MNLAVCIGYDSREPITLQVLAHSITRRASKPVTIVPIALNHLRDVYTRTDPAGTTEFSLTRFLTPWLCGYEGFGLFMDSDMVCLTDIYDLLDVVPPTMWLHRKVAVCQHDYVPKADTLKATGVQTAYPRKNWSSFMLFNNANCAALTPDYVNAATPAELHRFAWADDEAISPLPLEWNWLVGEYDDNPQAKVLHYTLGTPCFAGYEDSPMAGYWWREYEAMSAPLRHWTGQDGRTLAQAADAYAKAVRA